MSPHIVEPFDFAGNLIGLLATGGKTIYDVFINPAQFKSAGGVKEDGVELSGVRLAAKKKRERADISTLIAFVVLALSFFLLLIPTVDW